MRDATNTHIGKWTSRAVQPINGPRRGRLAVAKDGDLYLILPETTDSATKPPTMRILKSTKATSFDSYEEVWAGQGLTGEPLIDKPRLDEENILSVLVRRDDDEQRRDRDVAVLDFRL